MCSKKDFNQIKATLAAMDSALVRLAEPDREDTTLALETFNHILVNCTGREGSVLPDRSFLMSQVSRILAWRRDPSSAPDAASPVIDSGDAGMYLIATKSVALGVTLEPNKSYLVVYTLGSSVYPQAPNGVLYAVSPAVLLWDARSYQYYPKFISGQLGSDGGGILNFGVVRIDEAGVVANNAELGLNLSGGFAMELNVLFIPIN